VESWAIRSARVAVVDGGVLLLGRHSMTEPKRFSGGFGGAVQRAGLQDGACVCVRCVCVRAARRAQQACARRACAVR
jgi:hypothetical protein